MATQWLAFVWPILLDLLAFREQALRLIRISPIHNSLILHAFMDLFCSFVRVNLFSEKIPSTMKASQM
ncbi:hypothetical protein NC652_035460 [Populus alba x Populus x berolinensis]|nr:hypothetical protein NC652_035460 [Populus alba x Populus x berolinensis]